VTGNCAAVHSPFCELTLLALLLAVAWFGWTFCAVFVDISVHGTSLLQIQSDCNTPNRAQNGTSGLTRDSFIRDSFTEDALLRVWDQLPTDPAFASSEESHSREHQMRDHGQLPMQNCCSMFKPHTVPRRRFVLDAAT